MVKKKTIHPEKIDMRNNQKQNQMNKTNQKQYKYSEQNQRTLVKNNKNRETKVQERKKSQCPYFSRCGSCQHINVPYQDQLKDKQKYLQKLLGKFCKLDSIIGMEQPLHYRHKVHAVFGYEKGQPISGVYEEKSHRLVKVDSCLIENQKADEIILSIRGLLKSFKIRTYDERSDMGLLKHVVIRVSKSTGQIMVILVLRSTILPSKNNFAKALLKLHPEITTIVLNINDKATTMVLGKRDIVLYGPGYIEDSLCGIRFRLSPQSFYQINPEQTEVLYEKAISLAELTNKETVIDAYCGIGTIGMVAAQKAKDVIGIELNKEAIKDARENARINKCENISFIQSDAGKWMEEHAEKGESIDVVFMDPPRSGSDEVFLASLCKLSPKKIVYISCGPESLARDLDYLVKKGYKVKKIQPIDLFPMTEHVECVTLLYRVNS